jgi:hypothetical protein
MAAPKMNNSHAAVRRARSIHVANASSISALTSASLRPVRAGTWNEWSAS